MTPEMEVAVKYQSHLPALLACIAVTNGPVLELGVGHFSTPHLHALCGALNRPLVSVEREDDWFSKFMQMESPLHLLLNKEYAGACLTLSMTGWSRWGVAFIDSSPGGEARAELFRFLIDKSDFVVMHDAQKDAENFQAVEKMLDGLHRHLCTSVFPHTLVASKTMEIPEVLKGM